MHLSSEIALDFIDGRLNAEQSGFWQKHLEICHDCTQEVGRWRQLGTDLERSHLESAPDQELQKTMQIFPKKPDGGGSRVRSVLASLVFDSFMQPALAGARGTTAAARQLVMRAEEFDIHVKIWGEDDHRQMRQMLGQLLPRGGEDFVHSARFHLLRNGERIESTVVDEMGEFHFSDVPDGNLSLQIDLPNLTVIGALNLREGQ
jgi:hypothetical protein